MRRWIGYSALFLTCVVPLAGGLYIGTRILMKWDWAPRFELDQVDNLPLFIHVVGAMVYYTLAAGQILPSFRCRFPRWHRKAGRVAVVAGVMSALAATWLTAVHAEVQGPILFYGRMVFGPLWAVFLLLGIREILRRNVESHRAWMIRAFAVSMPASTIVFVFIPLAIVMDEIPSVLEDTIQSSLWVVHLAVAEVILRRNRTKRVCSQNNTLLERSTA